MSRSNNTDLINPAVRFFSWKGGEGEVVYFDKALGEKGENVVVDLPFNFLILDRLAGAGGGIDTGNGYKSYWSNAVRNTKTQKLVVRSKEGIVVRGFYDDIKGKDGVKFVALLYVAFYDENKNLQIGCLKLTGAALSAWFDFSKAHRDIYDGAFAITGNVKKKKGSNTYFEPVFGHIANVSDEADAQAKELDEHLQEYLTSYFAQTGIEEVEQEYTGQPQGGEFYDNEPEMPVGDAWEPEASNDPEVFG